MKSIHTIFRNRRSVVQTTRGLITLLVALSLLGFNPAQRAVVARCEAIETVVTPTTAIPLTGTFQTLNNGPGDQVDSHIDGELASYVNDDFTQGFKGIRYFDFATNMDHAVPGNGIGSQPDVSGDRISFIESTPSGPHVIIFDTVLQTRTVVPGFAHLRPALGSNLVAFEQLTFSPWFDTEGEIGIYDISVGTVTSLTDDNQFDKQPAVSPTGNVVAWTKCQTNESGCDIYTAIQTAPGVFTTQALTSTLGEERLPRTNGQLVVYPSTRDGETDIYYQPVGGGAETRISIPGIQRLPNISGKLISFESETPTSFYDLFVYDTDTAKLYQVTNTPLIDEVLSDISVFNGIARIVYGAPAADYDVFAFTFSVPNSTEDQISDLIELVESFGLPHGPENSLTTKLDAALAALEASDTATACSCLTAFINECRAQSGKKVTAAQSTQLINSANQIRTDLGCP